MMPDKENLEPPEEQSHLRPICHHIALTTFFECVGSLGVPGAYIYFKFHAGYFPPTLLEGVEFFGSFILGYLVPRLVFRRLIGAACPTPDCRGKAFPTGTKPLVYVCRSCTRSYPTELFEGDDGQT